MQPTRQLGGSLSDGHGKEPVERKPEYDRLLHRRKPMSGSEFAGVGLQFAVTIIVFALAGIWLDEKLGSSPWMVILCVFGGATLGFWSMYRNMMRRR